MSKKIIFKNSNLKSKIIIKNNFIKRYLLKLSKSKKIFCIVDKKVRYIVKSLENTETINFIYLNCNEKIKNIVSYNKIAEKILSDRIDRNCIIVGIGGGTLGDLSGFIASTILRGVDFKLIPTTLLSQVDSSIGGKNGINSKYGKNLIGTFYQPSEVIIDVSILKTLSIRELKSGYSEIIKHAIIKDRTFFNWLSANYKKILRLDIKTLEMAIIQSIKIKLFYVKSDYKENLKNNKSRAMLNFGHTFGHSLETLYNYKKLNHGEAVSIGMATESLISNKLGFLSDKDLLKILNHFKKSGLKIKDKKLKDNKVFKIMLSDKKNINNQINLVLLKSIGNSFFCRNMNLQIIKKIINNI